MVFHFVHLVIVLFLYITTSIYSYTLMKIIDVYIFDLAFS